MSDLTHVYIIINRIKRKEKFIYIYENIYIFKTKQKRFSIADSDEMNKDLTDDFGCTSKIDGSVVDSYNIDDYDILDVDVEENDLEVATK